VLLTADLLTGIGLIQFEDRPMPPPGFYRYWVQAVTTGDGGVAQWLDPLPVSIAAWEDLWVSASPNPSPGSVRLRYRRSVAGTTRLALFDAAGRLVGQAERADGEGVREWPLADIRNLAGSELPSGVYFLQLQAGALHHRARLVLLRRP